MVVVVVVVVVGRVVASSKRAEVTAPDCGQEFQSSVVSSSSRLSRSGTCSGRRYDEVCELYRCSSQSNAVLLIPGRNDEQCVHPGLHDETQGDVPVS